MLLSGKDDLMDAAEVKDMLDVAGHVKVRCVHTRAQLPNMRGGEQGGSPCHCSCTLTGIAATTSYVISRRAWSGAWHYCLVRANLDCYSAHTLIFVYHINFYNLAAGFDQSRLTCATLWCVVPYLCLTQGYVQS